MNGVKPKSLHRRASLRQAIRPTIERLEERLQLSTVNVSTYRYDAGSSGVNSSEVQLTPANVKVGSFGKIDDTAVDAAIYAEPLVESDIMITDSANTTAGAAGLHNVAFVATENGSIYAIDTGSGAVLWKRAMVNTANPTGDINNTLGATAMASVTDTDVGLPNSGELWDLTGTPVIDSTTNILYVVVRTKETIGGVTEFVQRLHALNLSDGTDAATPFLIGETSFVSKVYTNNTPIYVYGTGEGEVTDPYNGTGQDVVQFNALRELQRAALNLVDNTVYVAWASNGDNGPYHGFIASWNVANITTTGFKLSGVLCTSPNDGEAGIWQGGGALAFNSDDSAFYALTGNGTAGAPTLNADGFPTDASYNEALIKVETDPTTTATDQNANGWGMKITDFFIPYNVEAMDNADSDFGSGAPLLLPPSAGIPGHPNLIVAGGKDGRLFVLDADDLGGYHATYDTALNAVPNGSGDTTPPAQIAGTLSSPVYYNGKLFVVGGYLGNAKAFTISSTGTLVASSSSPESSFGSLPGGPTVSSDGASDGIVWYVDLSSNALRAYSASSLSTELWNSTQAAGNADAMGAGVKFAVPTIANGEVFVGTQDSLVIYGLTPPAGAVPNAPVLAAATLSSSSVNLTWTDSSVAPNLAAGYIIEDSTDDSSFTQVTTAPAGATSVAIGALTASTAYYFKIEGFNVVGDSPFSNVVMATTSDSGGGGATQVSPNAPTGLGATAASATSVDLTWTANSTNETGYELDRATDSAFTQNFITEDITSTDGTYTDTATGLAPGETFYYRLRAYNSAGDSGNSNVATAVIPDVPPKPTNQSITNVSTDEIDIVWQDNAGHLADGYRILRAVNLGTFTVLVDLPPTSRTAPSEYGYDDTDVTPGNYYEYHIEAYNVSGNNDFAGVNATTIANAPTGVAAVLISGGANLSWSSVTGAVSYNVYRGTTPGGEAATPIATGITGTAYTDTTILPGTQYYYEITAVNGNAAYTPPLPSESAASAEVSPAVEIATAAASTTAIISSTDSIVAGDAVTFSATVSAASGSGATPTGTVAFFADGNSLGGPATLVNGVAVYSTSALPVGAYVITASYSGDANYLASQSTALSLKVYPAYASALTASADSIGLGSPITFTDTLAPAIANSIVPTGTVTFFYGTTSIGTATIQSDGAAVFSTTAIPAGVQNITAQYSGDSNYLPGVSAPLASVVRNTPQSSALPTIDAIALPASAVAGEPANLKTSVTIANGGAKLTGKFEVDLYAVEGDSLNGSQALLASVHKRALLQGGKNMKLVIGAKALPADLPAGSYHLLAEVIDPAGDSSETTTSGAIVVAAPLVSFSLAVGSVAPATITFGNAGTVLVTLTNSGNEIASGKIDLTLGAALDPDSTATQITAITKTIRIKPGKSTKFKLRFKPTGILAPGSYYPSVSVSLAGHSATAIGGAAFTVI